MNILFVNYGDFTTNSLNHIGGFANTLCAAGHACIVAVPARKETVAHLAHPLFIAATYDELLTLPKIFPDGRPADLIHAWTPREGVRKFTLAYQRGLATPARLVIHLEDNEQFLLEAYTGKKFSALRDAPLAETDAWLVDGLPHPLRHETFLRLADGVTHIVESLRAFAPPGAPTQLLPPGVDFSLYTPQPPDPKLRAELRLRDDERVIVFTGSNTFANEPEMRELYVAVALLNQRGTPTRLIRTGFNSPTFTDSLAFDHKKFVIDLGFVEKAKLPKLLALADVLVQPGRAGTFNDYRLPSKLPEFLAMGKAVVLPPTNIALTMQDGRDAVFLKTGAPEEIADACRRLFVDPPTCAKLGQNAVAFAKKHFDLAANSRALLAFYEATLARQPAADWSLARDPLTSETELVSAQARARAASPPALSNVEGLASDVEHLALLTKQLESALELWRRQPDAKLTQLTERVRSLQEHASNLETILADTRRLTTQHVANIECLDTFGQLRTFYISAAGFIGEYALAPCPL